MYVILGASGHTGSIIANSLLLKGEKVRVTGRDAAAYAVALRHGVEDKWLDLELELWEALKGAVKKWEQGSPRFSALPFVSDWVQATSVQGEDLNDESFATANVTNARSIALFQN